jgi:putative copper export protein
MTQEMWYERTRNQILLFLGGLVVFVLVVGLLLYLYIRPENPAEKKDFVQTLGLITAGVAGALASTSPGVANV